MSTQAPVAGSNWRLRDALRRLPLVLEEPTGVRFAVFALFCRAQEARAALPSGQRVWIKVRSRITSEVVIGTVTGSPQGPLTILWAATTIQVTCAWSPVPLC